jgi:hypothetical protein
MIADYLAAEQDIDRVSADADTETLGAMLIGAVHLLFADRTGPPADADAVRKVVTAVLGQLSVAADRRSGWPAG